MMIVIYWIQEHYWNNMIYKIQQRYHVFNAKKHQLHTYMYNKIILIKREISQHILRLTYNVISRGKITGCRYIKYGEKIQQTGDITAYIRQFIELYNKNTIYTDVQ